MNQKPGLSPKEEKELQQKIEQIGNSPDDAMVASRAGYLLNKAERFEDASKYLWLAFGNFLKSGQYSMAVMVADELLSIHTDSVAILHRLSRVAESKDIEIPVLNIYQKYKGFHDIPLFSHLNEMEFLQLLRTSRYHDVKANKTIIKEGAKGDDIYLLVKGRIRVVKKIDRKKEAIVGFLGQGDFMGEIAYMADKRRSASIVAEMPCQLLSWKGAAIKSLNDSHPEVTRVLFKAFWERSLDTVLSLSPLFMHLDRAGRKRIVARFEQKSFSPKEVILQEGEKNPEGAIYIVKKGASAVFSEKKGSFRRPMAELKIGDVFGEYSALLNRPCTATVMAKTPLEVFALQRDAFVEMVGKDSTMARVLAELGEKRFPETVMHLPYFQLVQDLGPDHKDPPPQRFGG
jgi:CRP-like cAMP-binding protein